MIKLLTETLNALRRHYLTRLILLSVLVGVVVGLGSVGFNYVINAATDLFLGKIVGYEMPTPSGEATAVIPAEAAHRWLLFVVPALGGLLAGLTVYLLAPDAAGHGTDSVIDAFHNKSGEVRKRIPFVKTLATAFTLGTGGSAGREGPITQVGAGFGTAVADFFNSSARERRMLMVAGAGAGLGAIFRAPLGGALFAVEMLYRDIDFESPALVPSFVASIVSYSVYCGLRGFWGAVFVVPRLKFNHVAELPVYLALGVACALVGILYVKSLYGIEEKVFHKLRVPTYVKPAIGGLAVGTIGYFLPQVLGQGYGWVQLAMDGGLALWLIVVVAFVKILATSLTVGSGGSGGTFAPAVVVGGLLGAALGIVLQRLMPGISPNLQAFALVGMAGFLAGVAKTPLAALIMVSEMTTGYGLLVPLMLATAIAYVLSPRRISMYASQVNARVDSPAHEGEFVNAALERIAVNQAMPPSTKPVMFHRDTPLRDILQELASTKQQVFPVLDDDEKLCGVIDFHDVRIFFTVHEVPAVIAQDLLAPTYDVVSPEEDLASALRKFRTTRLEELPVVEKKGSRSVVGVLSRRNVIATYHDRLV